MNDYKYLTGGGCVDVPGISDEREFADLEAAWKELEFSKQGEFLPFFFTFFLSFSFFPSFPLFFFAFFFQSDVYQTTTET